MSEFQSNKSQENSVNEGNHEQSLRFPEHWRPFVQFPPPFDLSGEFPYPPPPFLPPPCENNEHFCPNVHCVQPPFVPCNFRCQSEFFCPHIPHQCERSDNNSSQSRCEHPYERFHAPFDRRFECEACRWHRPPEMCFPRISDRPPFPENEINDHDPRMKGNFGWNHSIFFPK